MTGLRPEPLGKILCSLRLEPKDVTNTCCIYGKKSCKLLSVRAVGASQFEADHGLVSHKSAATLKDAKEISYDLRDTYVKLQLNKSSSTNREQIGLKVILEMHKKKKGGGRTNKSDEEQSLSSSQVYG